LADNPKVARARAEASFKKDQKAREGAKAMAEYEAAAAAVRVKTERLRALRLAKEAAEKKSPTPPTRPRAETPPAADDAHVR
jgi:hypothetical protein